MKLLKLCCAQAEWRLKGHVALPINDANLEKAWKAIVQENSDIMNELAAEGERRVGRIALKQVSAPQQDGPPSLHHGRSAHLASMLVPHVSRWTQCICLGLRHH